MKKNIAFVSLDPSAAQILRENLRSAALESPGVQEFWESLKDLMDGAAVRTSECSSQSAVPYRLAIAQCSPCRQGG